MNINNFLERTSVRDFTGETMSKKDIELITSVINNAPTSTNTQQFSAIIVTDKKKLDWIGTKNWNQQHIKDASAFIIFVADRTRVNYIKKQFEVDETPKMKKHEFFRATIDATIAATFAMDALIEMGYGTTMVGGLYAFADELAKEISLPDENFIVVGLSVGKIKAKNAVKPKMQKVFLEKYDAKVACEEVEKYHDATIEEFTSRGTKPWKDAVAKMASRSSYTPAFEAAGDYVIKRYENMD